MLIRDLEGKSGLDRATIRFYEREGLINPERKENGYREYTQAHLDQLLKIRLLRQLGMSLETIKSLQQGEADFTQALTAQIKASEQKIRDATRAKEVCTELIHANASYATLDAAYYLRQLSQPAQSVTGRSFREPLKRPYHPIRRFLARMTDYAIARSLLEFILVVLLRIRPYGDLISNIINYGVPFLMVPVSAYMLHKWGTTPGKWLFGLSIQSENGGNLSYSAAKDREWQALRDGYGFGIPFWSLWRLYKSWKAYSEWETDWDLCTEYEYRTTKRKDKAFLAAAVVIFACVNLWTAADVIKPRYRGDLTISEFASNYNYYYSMQTDQPEASDKLQADGTWYPENGNQVVIYVDAQPNTPKHNFEYGLNGENIRFIRYEKTWTQISYFYPLSAECENVFITAVMSQQGIGLGDLLELAKMMDKTDFTEDGSITYQNIQLSWNIDTVNCDLINHIYYSAADGTTESNVSIEFEVTING